MKDKKALDWKQIGQFVALLVRLYSTISATLKKYSVGPEMISWLDGSGRDILKQKLGEIATEYKRQTTSVLRAEIDLDVQPALPFDGATVKKHIGGGKATIEKRVDGVYLNGKKLVLRRSDRQLNGKCIQGHNLLVEIEGQQWVVHNATLLDFFLKNPQFWPDDWKKDEAGNTIYIFFWGTQFLRPSFGSVCVRYGYWHGETVVSDYDWLGNSWHARNPAVASAS